MTPLLRLRGARIDRARSPWVDHWDAEGGDDRLLFVGLVAPLLSVLTGEAELARGRIEIGGVSAREAVVRGDVGIALRDADVPTDTTVVGLLRQSAELSGLGSRTAKTAAHAALERLELTSIAGRRISTLDSASRRATWLALAIVGEPSTIVVDDPVGNLSEAQADYVVALVEAASTGRKMVVTAERVARTGPGRRLLDAAVDAMVATTDGIVFAGPTAEMVAPARRYLVTAMRNAERLAAELGESGVTARHLGAAGGLDGVGRLVVTLPSGDTRPIVRAAVGADAPICELIPLDTGRSGATPPDAGDLA